MKEFLEMEQNRLDNVKNDLVHNLENIKRDIDMLLNYLYQPNESTRGIVFGSIAPAVNSALRNETEFNTRLEILTKLKHL